eukprot:13140039-Alexandrium_andersonii.AAC.1
MCIRDRAGNGAGGADAGLGAKQLGQVVALALWVRLPQAPRSQAACNGPAGNGEGLKAGLGLGALR